MVTDEASFRAGVEAMRSMAIVAIHQKRDVYLKLLDSYTQARVDPTKRLPEPAWGPWTMMADKCRQGIRLLAEAADAVNSVRIPSPKKEEGQ